MGYPVKLLTTLARDDNWALVNADPAAMMFIRKAVLPDNIHGLDKSTIWRQMIDIAQQNAAAYPDNPGSYKALGIAYRALDDRENARINEQKYQQRMVNKSN